ncbi:MAG: hypothetical protein HUU15_04210 [Candidatus Brocadiae bacterium]|nr:hypothetical protein [Candidatus Brocadiia bacterium]
MNRRPANRAVLWILATWLFLACTLAPVFGDSSDVLTRWRRLLESHDAEAAEKKTEDEERRLSRRFEANRKQIAVEAAPPGGAVYIHAGEDSPVLFVGSTGAQDGISIVLARGGAHGTFYLHGGDGGPGGTAGRASVLLNRHLMDGSRPNAAGTDGEQGEPWGVGSRSVSVQMLTGSNGKDARAGGPADLPTEDSVNALQDAVSLLAEAWPTAKTAEERGALIERLLVPRKPTRGVVAAWSEDASVLALVGADGRDGDPNGCSVQVVGIPAPVVIVIAGNAAPGGRPGTAGGEEGAWQFQGQPAPDPVK